MEIIYSVLYRCALCGWATSKWEDESEHACDRCKRWSMEECGTLMDSMAREEE